MASALAGSHQTRRKRGLDALEAGQRRRLVVGRLPPFLPVPGQEMTERAFALADVGVGLAQRKIQLHLLAGGKRLDIQSQGFHLRQFRISGRELFEKSQGPVKARLLPRRRMRNGRVQRLLRFAETAQIGQGAPAVVMRLGIGRIQAERLVEALQRLFQLTLLGQRGAEVVQHLRVAGCMHQRLPVDDDRFRNAVALVQQHGQIVVRFDEGRRQGQRRAQTVFGLGRLAQGLEGGAGEVPQSGVPGFRPQRGAEHVARRLVLPLPVVIERPREQAGRCGLGLGFDVHRCRFVFHGEIRQLNIRCARNGYSPQLRPPTRRPCTSIGS